MTFDWQFYLSIFLRRLPYFLIVAVLVTVFGTSVAVILPEKYRSQALLFLESEQISPDLAESTVQTATGEQLQIIQRQLLSRRNLIDLAHRFVISGEAPAPDAIIGDMLDRIVFEVAGSRGQATTLTVGFVGDDADQALLMANVLVTQLLEKNIQLRTGQAAETLKFFRQDLERLSAELDSQSAAMLAFRTAHQDSLPDSLDYRRGRQASLQEFLIQLQREQAALTERRLRLVALYENTGRIETDAANVDSNAPEYQLGLLQAELANALLIYSEQNPKVKLLKTRVTALERQIADNASATGVGGAGGEPSLYEIQLAEIDGELEYIAEQIVATETEIETLQASIAATPANAVQLAEMERHWSLTNDQYNGTVRRLVAAETGERIEVLSKGQRISVVEQPVLPGRPYSPNRKLIVVASLAMGLLLGGALVALMELMNRSIRRPVEISARLGITPIATLPFLHTRHETRRRRAILAAAFGFAIFGVSGGLYAVHTYYLPMDILVERVITRAGLTPILDGWTQRISG